MVALTYIACFFALWTFAQSRRCTQKIVHSGKNKVGQTVYSLKTITSCCGGYKRFDIGSVDSGLYLCDPICEPACSSMEFCQKPGICACLPGYEINLSRKYGENLCKPICTKCDDRHCVAPSVCLTNTPPPLVPKLPLVTTEVLRTTTSTVKPNATRVCINCTGPVKHPGVDGVARISNQTQQSNTAVSLNKSVLYNESDNSTKHICFNCTSSPVLTNKLYYVSTSTPKNLDSVTEKIQTTPSNTTGSKDKHEKSSWIAEHGVSVLLPVILVGTFVLVIVALILWRQTHIMVYLRGRYYVVDDHLPKDPYSTQPVAFSRNCNVMPIKTTKLSVDI